MVIRVPYAGGIGGVEHHCDSSEAYYAHTPGPARRHARPRSPTPTRCCARRSPPTTRWSSWSPRSCTGRKDEVDLPRRGAGPIGTRRRCGATGTRRHADRLRAVACRSPWRPPRPRAAEGWDLRGRRPALASCRSTTRRSCASVRRTGRRVVVARGARVRAASAPEIAARVTERCFHSPGTRRSCGSPGFDIPYPPPKLEQHHLPGVDRILDAVDRLQWDDWT